MQVTVPECLPERLETISYANEFAFLYDGIHSYSLVHIWRMLTWSLDEMEKLDLKQLPDGGRGSVLETFRAGAMDHTVNRDARPEKRLQAQIIAEMLAIDPPRAKTTAMAWTRFVQLASKTRMKPFGTLQEYIPARVIDAGELYVQPFILNFDYIGIPLKLTL
jgi:hypothetical protein